MNKPVRLSRCGGELLLRLLEQSKLTITATALEEVSSEARSALINTGALVRHDASRTVLTAGDGTPTFRDLAWRPDQNAHGYFDACDGSVVVPPESQMLFRVALPWWLAWLAASLALTNSGKPTELVPASAWDIGDLWITRQRNIPVVFVRRLHRDATSKALHEALQKRTGRSGDLILTSSRNPLQQEVADPAFIVVPIAKVMTSDSQTFAIDRTLLLSPYTATSSKRLSTKPLVLSPDGRQLTIKGTVTLDFVSKIHIAIIRRLVEGYLTGTRWRAKELLEKAGSGVTTLARAFGSKKWNQLKLFLKPRDGLWGFDL